MLRRRCFVGIFAAHVFVAAATLMALPSFAQADGRSPLGVRSSGPACNVTWSFAGTVKPWQRGQRPPLAIGDSTMINATRALHADGFAADARGCRQMSGALEVLRDVRRRKQLPSLVVMLVGTNGSITRSQIDAALRVLGPSRTLVMLTPRDGGDAAVVRAAGRAHSRGLRVLDWARYAGSHGFGGDAHLSRANGARLGHYIATSRRWFTPPPLACTQAAAQKLLGSSGLRAGTALCADITALDSNDMLVPVLQPGAAAASSWRVYDQPAGSWRWRYSDDGSHFPQYQLAGDMRIARGPARDLVLTAAAGCAECVPGSTWALRLRWHRTMFRVVSAQYASATPP